MGNYIGYSLFIVKMFGNKTLSKLTMLIKVPINHMGLNNTRTLTWLLLLSTDALRNSKKDLIIAYQILLYILELPKQNIN